MELGNVEFCTQMITHRYVDLIFDQSIRIAPLTHLSLGGRFS